MGFLNWLSNIVIGTAEFLWNGVKFLFGIKPSPPSAKIRAELRKQWLNLAPGEKEIDGVEWEGEIYYETPK